MKLALIVVNMKHEVITDLITSLQKQTNKSFVLYIIDYSKKADAYPENKLSIKIVAAPNKGYAAGVNVGLRQAINDGISLFCVLNDDTIAKSNFIDMALTRLSQTPSSLIGGKIYYAAGYEYHKDRYTKTELGNVLWYAGGLVDWNNAFTLHRGVDQVDTNQFKSFQQTEFITGCLMLFDKNVINRIGFWDESYFLYFEDADYCERAKAAGIKVYFDPEIIIWHKVSQSTDGSGSQLHAKFQRKNRVTWGIKYAPLRTKIHLVLNYVTGKP